MTRSSTSSSKTLQRLPLPTRTVALAMVLFLATRFVFLIFPDAFVAYPETLREFLFYVHDQQCAAGEPEPQIVLQCTSRLAPIMFVPIGKQFWRTKDKVLNFSTPGNSFWQMAALLRRHPHLLDQTDLQVIDVLPYQLKVTHLFPESDSLFLREGTLREKWLIRDPLKRLKAFADVVVPAWSHRHSAENWYRAAFEGPRTAAGRLKLISSIDFLKFPDSLDMTASFAKRSEHPEQLRAWVAELFHGTGKESRIQVEALVELMAGRPRQGNLLLIHPPYRSDFNAIRNSHDEMLAAERRLREVIRAAERDHVVVQWYEAPSELGLVDTDYSGDGAHFSNSGIAKLQRHLVRTYRDIFHPRP